MKVADLSFCSFSGFDVQGLLVTTLKYNFHMQEDPNILISLGGCPVRPTFSFSFMTYGLVYNAIWWILYLNHLLTCLNKHLYINWCWFCDCAFKILPDLLHCSHQKSTFWLACIACLFIFQHYFGVFCDTWWCMKRKYVGWWINEDG